jgi:predicted RNase H-like HicB family nuclease
MHREFNVLIERDADGLYVASVPDLPGCHTQAESLDEVTKRIREAILACLEVTSDNDGAALEFVGLHRLGVSV